MTPLGSGFSSGAEASGELWCRFNTTLSHVAYLSEAVEVCSTAQFGAGLVSVEVSTNGRGSSSGGAQYEFAPLLVSSEALWRGDEQGETVVTLGGHGG